MPFIIAVLLVLTPPLLVFLAIILVVMYGTDDEIDRMRSLR